MRLTGASGDFVEISVAGYQFPNNTHDDYDSNSLLIDTTASVNRRPWTSRDACLLTWEVEWPANWLEQLGRGDFSEPDSSFLEPTSGLNSLGSTTTG